MKNIKDICESQRVQELKWKAKQKFNDGKDWVINNKETIIVLAPIVISVVTPVVKSINKHVMLHKTKDLKELYCYDRSLGHYWRLRRELTNNEWVMVDRRKQNGERLSDILADMRVLK